MNVVPLRRNQPCRNNALVRALESALQEARAGRSCSGVIALRDCRGREHILPAGLYEDDRGALSNLGFKLQSMAADSGFG